MQELVRVLNMVAFDEGATLVANETETPVLTIPPQEPSQIKESSKKTKLCRFYSSKSGCRLGDKCPFLHDPATLKPHNHGTVHGSGHDSDSSPLAPQSKGQAISEPAASRVVSRPTPTAQVENPREFQLGQVRRRYKPKETKDNANSTVFEFKLAPSDPDFPFEMDGLDCHITVPSDYPDRPPTLRVRNKDIPRGFAINIEHGFDGLYTERRGLTLLALINALDRNLEVFLSEKKVETIKLVANADTRHLVNTPVVVSAPVAVEKPTPPAPKVTVPREPTFTVEEKSQAEQKRKAEVRQLEARLGRLPLYNKSADGIAYTIPIEPRKRSELPQALQAIKTVTLYVPLLYPLHPSRIQLVGVPTADAEPVQQAFEQKCKESDMNLMTQINNLSINFLTMSKSAAPLVVQTPPPESVKELPVPSGLSNNDTTPLPGSRLDDRSHIRVIPRPPEWDNFDDAKSDSSDYSYDSGDEDSDEDGDPDVIELAGTTPPTTMPLVTAERGTAIHFPSIELYGIELLEVSNLNISVKCERCKDHTEFSNLRNAITKSEGCKKCATQLSVTFRHALIYTTSVRAGFLDLVGCVPIDMLPSNFIPTCSKCSTVYPQPGIVSVRGETTSNVCRECHQKFTFKIPEVKFLRITGSQIPSVQGPRRKKEVLGLAIGEELPRRGRCSHYSKSLRWFRFSCCQKVYPCDRCHDAAEEHPNEHANRMICGFCSREQNYRPEDCGVCHGVLVGKKGGGFWEGGKGTRDRVRMSRKDKRKFRRAPREDGKKVGSAAKS